MVFLGHEASSPSLSKQNFMKKSLPFFGGLNSVEEN